MRTRRRRSLLTGLGVALAAAMLVAALVVSDSLGFGFDRAARASDLPDIIVRFDPQNAGRVAQRIAALPDIAAYTVRTEVTGVGLETADEFAGNGAVEVVGQGRRGYAIVGGRDVTGPGQVVVERGTGRGLAPRARRHARHRRTRHRAHRRLLRESRQRVLSARRRAGVRVPARGRPARRQPRRHLAARPAQPERGPRPGARDQLRPPGPAVRHALGSARAARPGGRNRDRPARGAVADRARHRERDAGRVRTRRGPAPARRDRRPARGRRLARAPGRHPGVRGAVRRGAGGDNRRDRRRARDLRPDQPAARAAQRTRSGGRAVAGAGGRVAREHGDPGARGGVAGVAGGGATAGRAAPRRRAHARVSRFHPIPRPIPRVRGRAHRARRAARRRPPDPPDRHRRRARLLDRVRAAAARVGVGAQLARDRPAGARQALPADRGPARLGGRPRALDSRRPGRRPALRGGGSRLVLARRDDRRDRLSR